MSISKNAFPGSALFQRAPIALPGTARFQRASICWGLFFLLGAASCIQAQAPEQGKSAARAAQSPQDPAASCRTFVQGFYTWYVPKHGVEDVLKYRRSAVSPELARALKEDLQASAKNSDEIVGLDFDPFLNAQDTAERYVVGKVTPKGDTFWAEIHRMESGKRVKEPDVTAEVACKEGKCFFVNFHYGKTEQAENENLLSVLKTLKKEREKHP